MQIHKQELGTKAIVQCAINKMDSVYGHGYKCECPLPLFWQDMF